jgi:DNA ligase-1
MLSDELGGAGRHKGRLGALPVELADGTRFAVGTGFSDARRGAPPPAGSIITFGYQELSDAGVPRFPSFVGRRHDVGWPTAGSGAAPPPVTPATPPSPAAGPDDRAGGAPPATARRFELVEGNTSKYWEVSVCGCEVTVRYGRIGAEGQDRTKVLADEEAARRHAEDLVEE